MVVLCHCCVSILHRRFETLRSPVPQLSLVKFPTDTVFDEIGVQLLREVSRLVVSILLDEAGVDRLRDIVDLVPRCLIH